MKPDEFLQVLWGNTPNGLVQVVEIGPRGARPTLYRSPVATSVLAGKTDVYTCVALAPPRKFPHGTRPTARQARGIAGLWLDLDVAGGPDAPSKNKTPIATLDDAIDIAYTYVAPTLLVRSGYGLHAWYLLDTTWLFTGYDEQDQGALMAAQWFQLHRRVAVARGWTVDHAHDLARLMRVPGTLNGKGGQSVPVDTIGAPGPSYTRDQLAATAAKAGPVAVALHDAPRGGDVNITAVGVLDQDRLEFLLEISPEVAAAFHHKLGLGSLSEYDLSLCSLVAHHGGSAWTDADLAALIGAHRLSHDPADTKHRRLDYVNRTVAIARQRAKRFGQADALEQLAGLARHAA